MTQEEVLARLKAQFGDAVGGLSETKGDRFVVVKGDRIVDVCRFLKETTGFEFDYCQDITAIDWPSRKVIEVVFHLYSMEHRHGLVLKVEAAREDPSIPTVEGVWKAANWLEREVYDMFGVKFVGHSDLRRILLPDDWVGFPLRKDYQEAGGYHGIENVRPDPLVQLTKLTEEKRKAVAAAAAAAPPPATATATATTTATTTTTTPATATATATTTTTATATATATATTSAPAPAPATATAPDSVPSSPSAPSPPKKV